MADYTIEAQRRTLVGKRVKRLRKDNLVPIVVYGPKIDPLHLQVPYRPLELALMHAGGTHLIDITFEGGRETVLARDVQRDGIRGDIMHVDFFAVDVLQTVVTEVPLNIVGESPLVISREGNLIVGSTTLSVEALPADLIDEIIVDISNLQKMGDTIHVRDLTVSEKVSILNDPDEMVATVTPMREAPAEGEEDLVDGAAPAQPEVIGRGGDDDEE